MTMELEECIKDGFDDSLRDYIQSEEYASAKQQEKRCLAYLEKLLNRNQKEALHSFMDAATTSNSMLLSEAYLHGVVEGIALRKKVVSEEVVQRPALIPFCAGFSVQMWSRYGSRI